MKSTAFLSPFLISFGMIFALGAEALTLGKITVLSSLGQPLIAKIDIPELSPEEANSIRVGMASAEAFKSAGLDYTPAVSQITVVAKRQADGRAIVELRTVQPINAPYLDLVLEVTWNAGRIVRDYIVLLDPPATSTQALVIPAPTLPIQSSNVASAAPAASAAAPSTVAPPTAVASPPPPVAAIEPEPIKPPPISSRPTVIPVQPAARMAAKTALKIEVTTKRGDTAATLASINKPEGISLDQMLVAMLHNNPDAFVKGNVNRLKSGVVLDIPSADDIREVTPSTARSNIQAQAKDFNDYRRKLSNHAATTVPSEPNRSSAGKVTANVTDRQTLATTDDRLTLAKPTTGHQATVSPETKIAQERAAAEVAARTSELQKNIADLKSIAPALAASAPAPELAMVAPSLPVAVQPSPNSVPVTENSFLEALIVNPLSLPIAGGVALLVLLAALFGIRRKRSTGSTGSAGFDTVFEPKGATDVDTKESPASTTMVDPPSQLAPAIGEADPIAEADVYLAYNRDVQAEEILKEAKRHSPKRTDVQVKLLEIYAKRQDIDAFDTDAQELHLLTNGEGDDWSKAQLLARDIGSAHALFKVTDSAFAVTEPNSGSGLIDFDLSSLTLDLPMHPTEVSDDPKLALADEYLSIGDQAGARTLIEEVIQQNAHPQVVALAHQMLARLG